MGKLFAILTLKIWGWTIKGRLPEDLEKCVIIAAPHTANSDFAIGWLAYRVMGVHVKFLIKKESFKFPFGILLRSMGGVPVDRNKSNNTVSQVVEMFNEHDSFYVAITPEGTRKLAKRWKKGFYFIARKANVPVVLAYMDYAKKQGGVGPTIYLTDDYDADLVKIQDFYKNVSAKYPENFNLTPQINKESEPKKSIKEIQHQYCCKR